MSEEVEHPLAESGIKGLTQLITTAMAGYLDTSNPELQNDLAEAGYKSFLPEDVEWDKGALLGRLEEAEDETSNLPPIIKIGDVWLTRRIDLVEKITAEYIKETEELTQI
jgi:hypothetical protein